MSVSRGDRLGPYEILARIGEGGMGEVWKARDTRLGRMVALKTSKAAFGERFEREARAAAALNHPHICTLHDVGPDYLVMEFVEGEPLQGPLPIDKTIVYAGQVLDALDAAHRAGIVHRDLKPDNILVTRQGVKLLDFGLARQSAVLTESDATLTQAITSRGEIVGTLQYMSPEQLQGKEADPRSDLFAFGCVLYEMLTGKRAFEGASAASVIAAIMEREPAALAETLPLDRVIRICLAKDPDDRWQNARDVKKALAIALDAPQAGQPAARPASRTPWLIAGVCVALAAAAVWAPWRAPRPADRPVVRLELEGEPSVRNLAISADGTRLAGTALGGSRIRTRLLSDDKWVELPGTEGATFLFLSPDGRWIGYFTPGRLWKVAIDGGGPVTVCTAPSGRGGSWGEDDMIVAALDTTGGLSLVPAAGGAPRPLTGLHGETADATTHRWPHLLPGGNGVIFSAGSGNQHSLWHVPLRGGRPKLLLRNAREGSFVKGGFLVYYSQRSLMGVPIDPRRAELTGAPTSLVSGVALGFRAGVAVSLTGTVVYAPGPVEINRVVSWLDSSGRVEPLLAKPAGYLTPKLSPDGRRLAVAIEQSDGANIWIHDWTRGTFTSLPAAAEYQFDPVWTPDGEYLAYHASGKLAMARADGSGKAEILPATRQAYPWSFSPGGDYLFFHQVVERDYDSFRLDINLPTRRLGVPRVLAGSTRGRQFPAVSPDGRWLASTTGGQIQVSALSPEGEPVGRQWALSNNGTQPRWAPNRQELLYLSGGGRLMAVSFAIHGGEFVAQQPRVWCDQPLAPDLSHGAYDLNPAGDRVVAMLKAESEPERPDGRLKVLLNVDAELRRRVAARGSK